MSAGYFIPAELMEKIDHCLKCYASYGNWHYDQRQIRAAPLACSAVDTTPWALADRGKHASEIYAELVKLYPLRKIDE